MQTLDRSLEGQARAGEAEGEDGVAAEVKGKAEVVVKVNQ